MQLYFHLGVKLSTLGGRSFPALFPTHQSPRSNPDGTARGGVFSRHAGMHVCRTINYPHSGAHVSLLCN